MMPKVLVRCPCYPSEDEEKVATAIRNIFPAIELTRTEDGYEGVADSIEKFGMQIRRQKILDTTRNAMLRGMRGKRTTFHLNKQVAFVGKVTFAEEATILGTIEVTVEDEDIESVIDRIAPTTHEGEEII